MDRKQTLCVVAILVLIVGAASTTPSTTKPHQQDTVSGAMRLANVTLSVQMPAYAAVGSPLKLVIHLKNGSQEDLYLAGTEPTYTSIVIIDAHGRQVPVTELGTAAYPNGDGGSVLRAGAQATREVDLAQWFKLQKAGGYQLIVTRGLVGFEQSRRTRALIASVHFAVGHEFDLCD
jgi:hypothetical protein